LKSFLAMGKKLPLTEWFVLLQSVVWLGPWGRGVIMVPSRLMTKVGRTDDALYIGKI